MDSRYTNHDRWHGEFHLDHCGALLDVEPMGPDYVRGMCHDIGDQTFDATALHQRTRAQVRSTIARRASRQTGTPLHCAWTVIIDPPPGGAAYFALAVVVAKSRRDMGIWG